MASKWIKNGVVVTSSDTYQADLLIEDGKIISIGRMPELTGVEVIDASGLYVFPGAVDEHTHMSMPFNGTESMPWETETVAAAVGGTTTIVDFALQARGSSLTDTIRKWQTRAEGNTAIDYNLLAALPV